MSAPLTVRAVYDAMCQGLELEWVAGKKGAHRTLKRDQARRGGPSLLGHLNLIHPNQLQVIGQTEMRYLSQLNESALQDVYDRLFSADTSVIILAESRQTPREFITLGNTHNVPVIRSPRPSYEVLNILRYFFTNKLAEQTVIHGVFLEVLGIGILISGGSNVGKSELALELITRGHRLIADDMPEFACIAPDILQGTCPPVLQDFLEVRGLGVLNIRAMYGDNAIKSSKYLRLIINLRQYSELEEQQIDRLNGNLSLREILGIEVPELTLPVAPGRNLAVLVEAAVRNHLLRLNGYNAALDLASKQQHIIEQENQ